MAEQPNVKRYYQLPLYTNWRSTDSIDTLRSIMQEHEQGYFLNSSTFWEECLTDDRIGAVMDTRIGGIVGADLGFIASDEKRKSQKLADQLGGSDQSEDDGLWLRMVDSTAAREILKWKIGIGVAFGQITWDTSDGQWVPKVTCWHPRFLRWDWAYWGFVVVSWGEPIVYLPRTEEETRGNGKWFVWGGYRSWMHGLVRSLGIPYIDRAWNQRDAARYSEKYGMGIVEGKVPAGASAAEKAAFENRLRNLGNEPTIVTPQGRTKDDPGFGIELHSVGGEGWQIFKAREDQINTNIAVRVIGQNLTTEVSGGSLAASKVHEHVRGDVKKADADFFRVMRQQVLTWWAQYAVGDPEAAPYPRPSFAAPDDSAQESAELYQLMQALALAPAAVDKAAILEAHGVPLLDVDDVAPALPAGQAPAAGKTGAVPGLDLTSTVIGSITRVNEARASKGLPPLDVDGDLTIAEYQAKHAAVISQAANAEDGQPTAPVSDASRLSLVRRLADPVALSARGATATTRRRAKYQITQAEQAARAASKALRPFITKVLAALDSADSYEQLRRLVISEGRRSGADVEGLAKLVAQVNLLARLHGREAALAGALK